MQTNKTCGPNNIPISIFTTFKKEFSKPLSDIINLSILTGTFPETMKIAKIAPVFKKDDKLNCSNYRPISLLTNHSHRQTLFSYLNCDFQLFVVVFG